MRENTLRAAALLRQAAARIESALILLDMRERACPACGARRFANLAHARIYQRWSDAATRLRDSAATLEDAPSSAKEE